MNRRYTVTLASLLNIMLVFCLLRFGLVMTAGINLFSLPLVVAVGGALIFLCLLVSKRYATDCLRLNTAFLFLNLFCIVCCRIVTENTEYAETASNYINQLIVLFLLWGFYLYMREQSKKTRKVVVFIYLSVLIISTLYTFYVEMNGHDRIIRETAFGVYDSSFSFMYGGFDFIYCLVLVYAALLTVLVRAKRQIKTSTKIFMLATIAIMALTVIASGYTTAFAIIMIYTILLLPKKTTTKLLWAGLLFVGFYVIPEQLADLISGIPLIPDLTATRINDIILSFTGQSSMEYIEADGQRFDRMVWSLRAFFANPLFGVVGNNAGDKLGYHTEWIDQLARYGLIATIFNTGFWVKTYSRMKKHVSDRPITYACVRNAFTIYLILGFVNPISMVVTTAPLFILCPFLEEVFVKPLETDNQSGEHV